MKTENKKTMISNAIFALRNISLALIAITALTFSSCSKDEEEDPIDTTGTSAPAFSLKDLSENTVQLSDFQNKVVVLFFFGNACPSCRAAAPSVQTMLVNAYSGRTDYMVLGLDQWDGNKAAVQSFQTITSVTFPLLQMASATASAYSTTFDRLVVVDKMGKIRFKGNQGAASDISAAKTVIDMYLAK